ncbi:hypothetical protein R5R35_005057 [Gryllus longicercus]|uniref:Uncharacterized protein n=1 Tax=Gryllus longicercus TaxID=2509291 RepID=A0AAN9VNQ7_9ORTH
MATHVPSPLTSQAVPECTARGRLRLPGCAERLIARAAELNAESARSPVAPKVGVGVGVVGDQQLPEGRAEASNETRSAPLPQMRVSTPYRALSITNRRCFCTSPGPADNVGMMGSYIHTKNRERIKIPARDLGGREIFHKCQISEMNAVACYCVYLKRI